MANIKLLADFILKWEGGFIDDPADAGGATNMGVTIVTWKQAGYDKNGDGKIDVADLKLLTKDDVINRVLKPHYWDRWRADEIHSQKIANILVDWVWGSGRYGIVIPQKILGVVADGAVGNKTLSAVNFADPDELFEAIFAARVSFLHEITDKSIANYEQKTGRKATEKELLTHTNKRFLKGWLNRLEDLKRI